MLLLDEGVSSLSSLNRVVKFSERKRSMSDRVAASFFRLAMAKEGVLDCLHPERIQFLEEVVESIWG